MASKKFTSLEHRILDNIEILPWTGCWIWMKGSDSRGYGHISVDGKTLKSHRVSWEVKHGNIQSGLVVCHKCDITSCVNPDHLFLGTQKDNMGDASKKGRMFKAKGELNPIAKLNSSDVIFIRKSNLFIAKLAKMFGVSQGLISRVRNNGCWTHI